MIDFVDSWDFCNCMCHRVNCVKHCIPCCNIYPYCRKGIIGDMKLHIKEIHKGEINYMECN